MKTPQSGSSARSLAWASIVLAVLSTAEVLWTYQQPRPVGMAAIDIRPILGLPGVLGLIVSAGLARASRRGGAGDPASYAILTCVAATCVLFVCCPGDGPERSNSTARPLPTPITATRIFPLPDGSTFVATTAGVVRLDANGELRTPVKFPNRNMNLLAADADSVWIYNGAVERWTGDPSQGVCSIPLTVPPTHSAITLDGELVLAYQEQDRDHVFLATKKCGVRTLFTSSLGTIHALQTGPAGLVIAGIYNDHSSTGYSTPALPPSKQMAITDPRRRDLATSLIDLPESSPVLRGGGLTALRDGKLLVFGEAQPPNPTIMRLLPSGAGDWTFRDTDGKTPVREIVEQPDRKLLVRTDVRILRLYPDGRTDETFTPLVAPAVAIRVLPDGRFLVLRRDVNSTEILRFDRTGVRDNEYRDPLVTMSVTK